MRVLFVVLMGMLLTALPSQSTAGGMAAQADRFQAVGEKIVYDAQTGLMWAARGNGKDIDWYEAQTYCKDYNAGGYDDWRMPEIKELATLYTKDKKGRSGFHIVDLITITDCCVWSADENMGGAAIFSYNTGKEPAGFLADTYQLRALPVRTHKQMDAEDVDVVKTPAMKH